MKCALCENDYPSKIMNETNDNDYLCPSCYEGMCFEEMKVKPIKKESNESIPNNFRTNIDELFGFDKNSED